MKKTPSEGTQGAILATAAFTMFAIHDVIIKFLGNTYSVFQIIFFATVFSFIPVSAIMLTDKKSGSFRPNNTILIGIRSILQVIGFSCAFFSFTVLELAEAYSLLFITPLLITVLAVVFLGEIIKFRRILAVTVGFLGVLIILRPGFSQLEVGHLTALLAALCSSIASIIVRKIGHSERSASLILVPMFTTVVFIGLLLPKYFIPPTIFDLWAMALIGIISTISQLTLIAAYRLSEAGVIAPFQYTQIIWAILFGYIFFNEMPYFFILLGGSLVVGSGIFIIWREQRIESVEIGPVTRSKSAMMDTGIISKSNSD